MLYFKKNTSIYGAEMAIMAIIFSLAILYFMYKNKKNVKTSFQQKLDHMSQRKQSIIKYLLPVTC